MERNEGVSPEYVAIIEAEKHLRIEEERLRQDPALLAAKLALAKASSDYYIATLKT